MEAAVDITRRARQEAEARASAAEAKASRLAQTALAVLALAITIAGYQLRYVRAPGRGTYYWLLMIPAALAIVCLGLGAIMSFEVERVGLYYQPQVDDLHGDQTVMRDTVRAEERGRQLANWTATNKFSTLIKARAWLSRGLVGLTCAALIAAVTVLGPDPFPAK